MNKHTFVLRLAAIIIALNLLADRSSFAAITVLDYYRLGENDPGEHIGGAPSATKDSVGTNDLSVSAAPFYASDVAAAAAGHTGSFVSLDFFQGGPYCLSTNVISTLTDNFGVEAWVKVASSGGNRSIAYNGNSGSNGWGIYQVGSTFQGLFGGVAFFGSAAVTLNTWTHVAVVRNNGTARLYINGVSVASTNVAPNKPVGAFGIATSPTVPGTEVFSRYIDEVRVFTFAANQFSTNDLLLNGGPPGAITLAASNIINATATIAGTIDPDSLPTSVWFQWGNSAAYGNTTATNVVYNKGVVQAQISGLVAGEAYHFHAVASNQLGSTNGLDKLIEVPIVTPAGPNPYTNAYGVAYSDPGATLTGSPIGFALGGTFQVVLKGDGTVVANTNAGDDSYGQTDVPANVSNVVAVSSGLYHTLALTKDNVVYAWGAGMDANFHDDEGNFEQSFVPFISNPIAIAAGAYHSLALQANGMVVGWGANTNNNPGSQNLQQIDYGQENVPGDLSNVVAIAASDYNSMALKADGTVALWGNNDWGQTNIPAGLSNVVAIAAGSQFAMALKNNGKVVAWGNPFLTNVPAALSNVVAISAGTGFALALRNNGTIVGWPAGSGSYFNALTNLSNVVFIEAGSGFSQAMQANGAIIGTGPNFNGFFNLPSGLTNLIGNIGASTNVAPNTPGPYTVTIFATNFLGAVATATRSVYVTGPPTVTTQFASQGSAAGITLNAAVNPNGTNTTAWFKYGALSNLSLSLTTTPTNIGGSTSAVAVATRIGALTPGLPYYYQSVASNHFGVTKGMTFPYEVPVMTLNGSNSLTNLQGSNFVDPGVTISGSPVAIDAGYDHLLALRADGRVSCWGNVFADHSVLSNIVAIAAGNRYTAALKSDGTVTVIGNTQATNIPPGLSNVVAISAGGSHCLAVKSDGTVVGWGDDSYGQIDVPSDLRYPVAIAAGFNTSFALTTNGTIESWGQSPLPAGPSDFTAITAGGYGIVAGGSVVSMYNDPSPGSSLTDAVAVGCGELAISTLVLKSNGTVFGFGDNFYGEATGVVGGPTPALVMVNGKVLSNVVAVAEGYRIGIALKSDGTIVGFGQYSNNIPTNVNILTGGYSVTGAVNTNAPGIYNLTYSSTNLLGGTNSVSRTVTVVGPPSAIVQAAGALGTISGGLTGQVNPNGAATTSEFVWGATTNYGNLTSTINLTSGFSFDPIGRVLFGLQPGTRYYYAIASSNIYGTNLSVGTNFVTLDVPRTISSATAPAAGQFQLQFVGGSGASYSVLESSNLLTPVSNWTVIGAASFVTNTTYQFTDTHATNQPRFYRVRSP